MPPSTTIGSGISQADSRTAPATSRQEKSDRGWRWWRFTHRLQPESMISISRPGSTPARNNSSIDCWATTPYRISGSDGANSRPRLPALVTSPRLSRALQPGAAVRAVAGDQPQVEALGITGLSQRGIQDGAQRDDGDTRGARECREESAGGERDDGEPAGHPAQQGAGDAHQPAGRAALAQHEAREREQRYRQQERHGADAEELDGHGGEIDVRLVITPHGTRGDDREQRRTEQRQQEQGDTEQDHHGSR